MSGPWFSIPFGVALAAYSLVQLGSTPHWWNIATTAILLSAAVTSVLRGVLDLRARRRAPRD
ncbi:hypothetical protein [Microbacterium sp. NPDC089188]|uniref:hypothetical protein n=1 Tax=Microbacterium sp. NPDC089188 TaxID=3154971 RepID=UPI003436E8D3